MFPAFAAIIAGCAHPSEEQPEPGVQSDSEYESYSPRVVATLTPKLETLAADYEEVTELCDTSGCTPVEDTTAEAQAMSTYQAEIHAAREGYIELRLQALRRKATARRDLELIRYQVLERTVRPLKAVSRDKPRIHAHRTICKARDLDRGATVTLHMPGGLVKGRVFDGVHTTPSACTEGSAYAVVARRQQGERWVEHSADVVELTGTRFAARR